MNLSKYKWWRALLQRVIAKQQSKREQTHPVYLQVQKYEKVENVNTQNDYETSKKRTDKKTDLSLCFVNVFKFQEDKFNII